MQRSESVQDVPSEPKLYNPLLDPIHESQRRNRQDFLSLTINKDLIDKRKKMHRQSRKRLKPYINDSVSSLHNSNTVSRNSLDDQ